LFFLVALNVDFSQALGKSARRLEEEEVRLMPHLLSSATVKL
jgi:hypothetical protein